MRRIGLGLAAIAAAAGLAGAAPAPLVAGDEPIVATQLDEARLRFSPGLVRTLAALGGVAAVVIAALGWSTDARPYALIGGWLVLGLAYYAWRSRRRPAAA